MLVQYNRDILGHLEETFLSQLLKWPNFQDSFPPRVQALSTVQRFIFAFQPTSLAVTHFSLSVEQSAAVMK